MEIQSHSNWIHQKYGKVYIEGKVDDEYLPATTKVNIEVYKEGETTPVWNNTPEDDLLKPYAEQTPTPAGFRYEIEFGSENPEPGVYEIKVFVENPAGLKSDIKTAKVRVEPVDYYFHVQSFPGYAQKDGENPYQSSPFDLKIKAYKYGKSGRKPDDQAGDAGVWVNKLESTQGWWYNNNTSKWEKEKCLIEQDPEPVEFTTYAEPIVVILSPLYKEGEQDGLYLGDTWDGTITLKPEDNGEKSLTGLRYRKKDDSDSLDEEFLLIIDAKDDAGGSGNGDLKIFKPGSGTLASGYWDGTFGYLHKAGPTPENPNPKPLLYKYPFNSDPIDLDFSEVMGFTNNYLGHKWYYDSGSWHSISAPQWTDHSWKYVRGYTLRTNKTKCNGRAYVYRLGSDLEDPYYLRIWTLTNGVWGYTTYSGWAGIDWHIDLDNGEKLLSTIWEWHGDIYYIIVRGGTYYKNGVFLQSFGGAGDVSDQILVSSAFTYARTYDSGGYRHFEIFSKSEFIGCYSVVCEQLGAVCLIDTDKCLVMDYHNFFYRYAMGGTVSDILELPASPNGCDGNDFNGGEGGKAISYHNGKIAGFDPVAGEWTDYGCPWEK